MDTSCKKNLEIFLNYRFFITENGDLLHEFYKRYPNGIIGSIPKHPLFLIIFKNMFERTNYSNDITYSTGTKLFYDCVQEYLQTNKNDITIIEPKYLHPCGIFNASDCKDTCQDCYIVHTNYSSWTPSSKIIKFITKNLFFLFLLILIIIIIVVFIRSKN